MKKSTVKKLNPGARVVPPVTLPPFPWETAVTYDGRQVRLARPAVVQRSIALPGTVAANGDVVACRARVWQVESHPALTAFRPQLRAALLDYAEAAQAVGASGGTSDPTGGGGGRGGASDGPSLRALQAAQRLGRFDAALADGSVTFFTHRIPGGAASASTSFR